MVDLKQVGERLQSARLWILHAEESFDKQKDIRGELDLLLAQAELRRVREARQSCRWRHKYSFLGQMAALCLAVIMVTAGIGGAYWLMKEGARPQVISQPVVYKDAGHPEEKQMETEVLPKSVQNPTVMHQAVPSRETSIPPQAHQTVLRQEQKIEITTVQEDKSLKKEVSPDKVVSHDEMQKLIQTAGRSLRGQ